MSSSGIAVIISETVMKKEKGQSVPTLSQQAEALNSFKEQASVAAEQLETAAEELAEMASRARSMGARMATSSIHARQAARSLRGLL